VESTVAGLLRRSRLALAALLLIQAGFATLHLWMPGWRLVNLDREHNFPTWFHSWLLALVALQALDLIRVEGRLLGRAGRRRAWAAAWPLVAGGFAYLAADETLVIHEGFLTAWLRGRLAPSSPLELTLAWLLIFLPAIVFTVAFLLASLGARARLCPRLLAWGGGGLGLWVLALTCEATAKSFFIPRNLYWLEVVLEETAESLGTTCFAWALWRYRLELGGWVRGRTTPPAFAVPWRWVAAGTLALALPVAVVGVSIAWNPYALHRYIGDDHLRAGRLEEAVRAYRAALATAPAYGRAWYRLGVAELRRGDLAAAEQALAMAARLEPRNATTANDLGVVLLRQGRDGEAAAAFTRATALDPDDARAAQNLAIALRRLGREAGAEAALARARALRPPRLRVTALRMTVPADVQLAYVADPRLDGALGDSRAGRVESAISGYRRALARMPDLAPAHLGLANELVRWRLAVRLTTKPPPARAKGASGSPARTAALFSDWVQDANGGWSALEAVVEPPPMADDAALAREARGHFEHALALGAGAPAQLGLAALARLEGDAEAVSRHLAAARAADPSLPPAATADTPLTAAAPR
jgi:tetratricopeptide (TPR) repeat protein